MFHNSTTDYSAKALALNWLDFSRTEKRTLDIVGSRNTLDGVLKELCMLAPHQKRDGQKWVYSGFGWQIVIHLRS